MNRDDTHKTRLADVRRRSEKTAARFERADFVHAAVRDGLLERIDPVVVEASIVLDVGCATGAATRPLETRFRGATVVGVDLSLAMLERSRKRGSWFRRVRSVQADAAALPFADGTADVLFANLLVPHLADPPAFFAEAARILRKGGLFVFSALGPDSFGALRRAWAQADDEPHVGRFPDMHDLGDALIGARLADPVLDVDRLTVTYPDPRALFRDLTDAGARNTLSGRRPTLSGRRRLGVMQEALQAEVTADGIPVELEVVYGHAWGAGGSAAGADVAIPAGSIPVRRRRR